MQNRVQQNSPLLIEKVISALSYITFGVVGFAWILLGLFTKSKLKPFLQYHIFQSLFLAFTFTVVCLLLDLFTRAVSIIPFFGQLLLQLTIYLNMPLLLGFSLIQLVIYCIIFYLVATCVQGQYSYLPWFSNIIKQILRNN